MSGVESASHTGSCPPRAAQAWRPRRSAWWWRTRASEALRPLPPDTEVGNRASRRVLEKSGFELIGDREDLVFSELDLAGSEAAV